MLTAVIIAAGLVFISRGIGGSLNALAKLANARAAIDKDQTLKLASRLFAYPELENLLKAIAEHRARTGRFLLSWAEQAVERILGMLHALQGVRRAEAAGSFRRRRETVGDLDFLVACERAARGRSDGDGSHRGRCSRRTCRASRLCGDVAECRRELSRMRRGTVSGRTNRPGGRTCGRGHDRRGPRGCGSDRTAADARGPWRGDVAELQGHDAASDRTNRHGGRTCGPWARSARASRLCQRS
jgi:hypothetical protein